MLWQVGVGLHHQEVDCLLEEWDDIEIIGFIIIGLAEVFAIGISYYLLSIIVDDF